MSNNIDAFEVRGGNKLKGEITPQGAKNEALQILCAVLLTDEKVTISNIPNIHDVNMLIKILGDIGVKVNQLNEDTYTFESDAVDVDYMMSNDFKKNGAALRGSIMLVGPLLARFKKAYMPKPGGDKIGRRRLDTHFLGFESLGAKFHFDADENFYSVEANELKGCYMSLL
jgi:UDP-N-acetylglucosamine 1-carboxyvinyltransferase